MNKREDEQRSQKRRAALHATTYVEDGMVVGLGTGSTSEYAVRELGRRSVKEGLRIKGVPTSERTAYLARSWGILLTTLEEHPRVDITIDGADEVDLRTLNVIKGMGGALLREKIVALASDIQVLIVDASKVVGQLGERTPVPVEVAQFGWTRTCEALADLGCETKRREKDGEVFVTDGGNYLIDCRFPPIDVPESLAERIKQITGVVEHGLFIDIARRVVIGHQGGRIEVVGR
jgi:ribose 5-phosphate isomerase A